MRRRDYYWSLFNKSENRQLDNFKTEQIEAIFAVLSKVQHADWLIWRDGFDSWHELVEFPELISALRKASREEVSKPPPPKFSSQVGAGVAAGKPAKTNDISDLSAEGIEPSDLKIEHKDASEDRNNKRFDKSIEVRLSADGNDFVNRTVNISMKGMQLKDPVPKSLPKYFNVELVNASGRGITVLCSRVSGQPKEDRIRIVANDHADLLLTFLLTGI